MVRPLRLLLVEDSEDDAQLLTRALRHNGFDPRVTLVDSEAGFADALARLELDLILCDYSLPAFDAFKALEMVRDAGIDVPFIVVSGMIGEDRLIQLMQVGAQDIVLKDNLARLVPAINRELVDAVTRRERKQAEQGLLLRERAIEALESGILVADAGRPDLPIIYVNPTLERITGYAEAELLNRSFRSLQGEGHDQPALTELREAIEARRSVRVVLKTCRKDGSQFWSELGLTPIRAEGGAVTHFVGIIDDITERRAMESALRASEARFRGVVDNSPSAIFLQDLEGRFLLLSRKVEDWHGSDAAQALGKTAEEIFPLETAAAYAAQDREVLRGGRSIERECDIPFADGKSHQVIVTKFPVTDSNGRTLGVGTINTDITEHRLAEARFRQAQKMEAVGQLTGGVAHDFNNLLTVIIGNLQLLSRSHPEDEKLQKRVATALLSAQRGSELTARLTAFSRQQVLEAKTVSLNELVSEMGEMLHRTLGESVVVEMSLASDLGQTRIDPSQMESALLNLAINARDAMPEGGRLTIGTGNVELGDGDDLTHDAVPPGRYVTLAVSDTGVGMAEDVLERVFDPFFTTKEIGSGTGLGLSMVYGFVKQSRGRVRIFSEPGHGTTVRIYLPRVSVVGQDRPAAEPCPPAVQGGTETILVVEDEDDVRQTAVAILEHLGYRVVEAADGKTALALLARRPDIDLLFTDVVMPGGMTGPELAREIEQLRPGMRVLLTSGYAGAHQSTGDPMPLDHPWIVKPYREQDLARQVRAALDRPAPGSHGASRGRPDKAVSN